MLVYELHGRKVHPLLPSHVPQCICNSHKSTETLSEGCRCKIKAFIRCPGGFLILCVNITWGSKWGECVYTEGGRYRGSGGGRKWEQKEAGMVRISATGEAARLITSAKVWTCHIAGTSCDCESLPVPSWLLSLPGRFFLIMSCSIKPTNCCVK